MTLSMTVVVILAHEAFSFLVPEASGLLCQVAGWILIVSIWCALGAFVAKYPLLQNKEGALGFGLATGSLQVVTLFFDRLGVFGTPRPSPYLAEWVARFFLVSTTIIAAVLSFALGHALVTRTAKKGVTGSS